MHKPINNLNPIDYSKNDNTIEISSLLDYYSNFQNDLDLNGELDVDYSNFSLLLVIFMFWMKKNHSYIQIITINNGNFKIKINKGIGKGELENFSKIFEELTLTRASVIDFSISNEWICELTF